jgi:hypothetical protein
VVVVRVGVEGVSGVCPGSSGSISSSSITTFREPLLGRRGARSGSDFTRRGGEEGARILL